MSPSRQDNPSHRPQLFSVVGAAYVPEDRTDNNAARLANAGAPEAGTAGVWLVVCAVLIGVSLAISGTATKVVEFARAMIP